MYHEFIEPLAVYLRHPIAKPCFKVRSLFDKTYMVLRDKRVASQRAVTRSFLFDVGCSTFNKGRKQTSLRWFVQEYALRGVTFDHMFGWEAANVGAKSFWSQMPSDLKPRFSFYNVAADSNVDSGDNPLNFIRAIAKPDDFVVLKLDIDNTPVESRFVDQILADTRLHELIDEFFWEHHVIGSPMAHMGWSLGRYTDIHSFQNLSSSYRKFTALRQLGIRAHSCKHCSRFDMLVTSRCVGV